MKNPAKNRFRAIRICGEREFEHLERAESGIFSAETRQQTGSHYPSIRWRRP